MICLRLFSALKSIVLLYKVVTNFTIYCVMPKKGWDAVFHCDLRYVLCEFLYVRVFGILIMLQRKSCSHIQWRPILTNLMWLKYIIQQTKTHIDSQGHRCAQQMECITFLQLCYSLFRNISIGWLREWHGWSTGVWPRRRTPETQTNTTKEHT